MPYKIKEVYAENKETAYGVFPTSPSRFDGSPVVKIGTEPIEIFETWKDANDVLEGLEAVASYRNGGAK